MIRRAARSPSGAATLLFFLLAIPASAQPGPATMSGTVTDSAGAAVAHAKVAAKNLASDRTTETQASATGAYRLPDLAPGEYEVTVSAEGFTPRVIRVTIAAAAVAQTLNVTLAVPSGKTGPPSLSELGFEPSQMQGSAEEQARLDRRSRMLKIHQRLGLITAAPMVATVIAGTFAGGRQPSSTGRQVHAVLGATTAGLYFTTASYAIFAPKVPGTRVRGPIRLHRALAWVHGTGMVLTPVLGVMAYRQRSRGERVHGAASFHGSAGVVTAAAYGAAILSVSVKF